MRLFIAINFNDEIKSKLCEIQDALRGNAVVGNWTKYDNLHLTLAFLGEVAKSRVPDIKKAITDGVVPSFPLAIVGTGRFKRDGGDIWWVGISESNFLTTLHTQLLNRLSVCGFPMESRKFKPHLTLGREVVMADTFDIHKFRYDLSEIKFLVDKISLMKSERIAGKLTYTSIYEHELL